MKDCTALSPKDFETVATKEFSNRATIIGLLALYINSPQQPVSLIGDRANLVLSTYDKVCTQPDGIAKFLAKFRELFLTKREEQPTLAS